MANFSQKVSFYFHRTTNVNQYIETATSIMSIIFYNLNNSYSLWEVLVLA